MEGDINMPNLVLPAGFRFHPTDEELIVHYLKKKVSSSANMFGSIIADIDLYKFNPWELPGKAMFGENEWFFFSPRDRKYPNGARPNRAAASGYWKATGTDKPILTSRGSQCIGVKKALVFYKGRPQRGTKTSWMMYEYRLLDHSTHSSRHRGSMRLDDWVLCRIRQKNNTDISVTRKSSSSSSCNLEGFEENNTVEKINYLEDYELMDPQESEVVDEHGHLDFEGGTSSQLFNFYANSEINNKEFSTEDALRTIKRVLSVGDLNEQVPFVDQFPASQ